jgi:DNA-binding NarL/FixJ family response regulator
MARVWALCPDLMFGSRMAAALQAAGEQLELLADAGAVEARLRTPAEQAPEVLIVDLTSDSDEGIELVASLAGEGPRTLGFYSHVEADVRERAEAAGFDLVVPRSRMAREGDALVARLLADAPHRGGG